MDAMNHVQGLLVFLEIPQPPLSPDTDRMSFFQLFLSDNEVIVSTQFVFQPCALICNVLFHIQASL
jgi:hypothetical protein